MPGGETLGPLSGDPFAAGGLRRVKGLRKRSQV